MTRPFVRSALLALCLALAIPAAAASAAGFGTVQLSSSAYSVTEGQGAAVVTVTRTDASGAGQVRYGVNHITAQQSQDYQPVGGRLDFAPGQASATFSVPIVDDTNVEPDETVHIHLYGPHPMKLGAPSEGTLTIHDNDAISTVRDPVNPLGLTPPPPLGNNPLVGAHFYTDPTDDLAGKVAHSLRHREAQVADKLSVIADEPESKRFGTWTKTPQHDVAKYLAKSSEKQPGAVPLLATYRLQHVQCGQVTDTPAQQAAYKRWYQAFAQGIGNHDAAVFLEIDGLITTNCLSHRGLAIRIEELRSAIDSLAALPHAVVYVDAGAADALPEARTANLLERVGDSRIQGFFLNSTHSDWTVNEIRYGRWISGHTGGKHFVVNTATNGKGPLRPKSRVRSGNEIRCNPPGRGLGPRPTSDVTGKWSGHGLDGFFWIGNPGRSAGQACSALPGAPPTGQFWVRYALMLIENADYRIRGGR